MRARRLIAASLAAFAVVLLLVTTNTEPETTGHEPTISTPPEPVMTAELIETTPPDPSETPSRFSGIEVSEDDVETLARLVWLEARGEPFEGQVAVVEVVLNRILSPSFPGTVEEVVYQRDPIQFSPAALIPDTTPGEEQYRAVEEALAAEEPITDADVVYFSTSAQNERVFTTIGAHVFCRE